MAIYYGNRNEPRKAVDETGDSVNGASPNRLLLTQPAEIAGRTHSWIMADYRILLIGSLND